MNVLTTLDLPAFRKVASGKVREIFDLGEHYLFVATDRISAFDCVLASGIPFKGAVLTQLSKFWFEFLGEGIGNHLVSTNFDDLPKSLAAFRPQLEGRFMLVKKLEMVPVECVVRGYLVGSGYKEYRQTGSVCGLPLPPGMQLAQKLETPLFTPAAKAQSGHDENISFERMVSMVGRILAEKLRDLSIDIYRTASEHAAQHGVIIADTKFEFGLQGDRILLADEVLTPDSSRYWPSESYATGQNPPSFDKQFVRDYLDRLDWNKQPPAPGLPPDVVQTTSEKYRRCYQIIVGKPLTF